MARRWARERFAPVQADLEQQWCPQLPQATIVEMAEQGWLPAHNDELSDWTLQTMARLGQALGEDAAAAFVSVLTHVVATHLSADMQLDEIPSELTSRMLATSPYWEFSKVTPSVQVEFTDNVARLSGSMRLVVNCDVATTLVVCARAPEGEPIICCVNSRTAGVNIGEPIPLLGLRGALARNVELTAVVVADKSHLCRGEVAQKALESASNMLGWGVIGLLAGLVAKACEQARDYAGLRRQGGRRIIEHPPVAKLLEIVESSQDQLVLWLEQLDTSDTTPAAPLQLARKIARAATDAAMQTFGGVGYVCPGVAERCWRDARQAATLCSVTPWLDPSG